MKTIVAIAICILTLSGCATIESRPVVRSLPDNVVLPREYRVLGFNTTREWVLLPAGVYKRRFQEKNGLYYMKDDARVVQKTLFPERERQGGIFYSTVNGRWYAFTFLREAGLMMAGTVPIPVGDPSRFIPVPSGVVPDDILGGWHIDANQAPEPTPTTVTPPAGRLRKASPGETQEAHRP